MLDYTIVAGQRVWRSIRRISLTFNVLTQIVSILVLVYTIVMKSGLMPVNVTLLVISSLYFIFYCATVRKGKRKRVHKRVKIFFKWSKRGIKLVNLGIMIYALVCAKDPTPWDIAMPCASMGMWVLDIAFEIAAKVVKGWGELMFEAVKADVDSIIAPFSATTNFLRGVSSEESALASAKPSKERLMLDDLVAVRKAELKKKKAETGVKSQKELKGFAKFKKVAKLAISDITKARNKKNAETDDEYIED